MKYCKYCGAELKDDDKFCTVCGKGIIRNENNTNEIKPYKSNNKIIIVSMGVLVPIIVLLGMVFLFKDNILYTYYEKKEDLSSSVEKSITYYISALDYNYSDDIINKITDKVKEEDDFEDLLNNLYGKVKESDLNNIYVEVYVSKAKENFNNKNYETTLNYLYKAEEYNYDIESFEYYNDLLKAQSEGKEKEVVKQDIHIYKNETPIVVDYSNYYDYFIIPDSNTRYLSEYELYGYDDYTLSLIRNEIFARYGYVFKKEEYRNYFNSMPWYTPNPSFSGSVNDLNSIEKYNVELIKSLE